MKNIFFVAMLLVAGVCFAQSALEYRGPIIDVHLHGYAPGDLGKVGPNPATGQKQAQTGEEQMRHSIQIMKEHNVVLGVVSGRTTAVAQTWAEYAPGLVIRGIQAWDPKDFLSPDAFASAVAKKEIAVLGEVGAEYEGLSPSDPVYDPYWAIAERNGIPVAIHTGASFPGIPYKCCPKFRLRFGDPLLLEDMLVKYPKLRVDMMHAGGLRYQNAIDVMSMYPQVYADLGAMSWIPGTADNLELFLKEAQKFKMLDRVMFGTDQMVWPEAIAIAIARVNSLKFLTPEQKKAIFYDNAARFLGLTKGEIARHQRTARSGGLR